jgi:hypothetical protein
VKKRYTPVQHSSAHGAADGRSGFQPQVLASKLDTETPKMTKPGIPTANPVTKGDKTSGRGRYEKGRMDKSRS